MNDVAVLSEADVRVLKGLVSVNKRKLGNVPNKPFYPEKPAQSPDVYIALTPAGGIPALTPGGGTAPDVPGSADCDIYRILEEPTGVGTAVNQFLDPALFTQTVFNLSDTDIAESTWITVVRDKFGVWLAPIGAAGGGGGGLGAGKGYVTAKAVALSLSFTFSAPTMTFSGPQTMDGVSIGTGDDFLYAPPAGNPQAGVWRMTSATTAIRHPDANSAPTKVFPGLLVTVFSGNTYDDTGWELAAPDGAVVLETTPLTFVNVFPLTVESV